MTEHLFDPLPWLIVLPLAWAAVAFLLGPGRGAWLAIAGLAGQLILAVLLHLAGLLPAWASPGWVLRLGLAGAFLVFLAVAAALLAQGSLLQFPPAWAGALILLIEAGLTISLGLVLAGLFLLLSGRRGGS